jgi:lysyl-tRNA synthetase class 2
VHGEVATSRRGELSVMADAWAMTAKSVRPLPVAHRELSEETRVRQRYVDLIVRPQAREMVRMRSDVVRTVRSVLHDASFVEVETPMLQLQHGGATARPFVTHANALDTDLYLRIAPELFLKRCVVGGIERVFEINRNFRNEGIDSTHSPEFAMLEAYQAYATYDDMANLTQRLVVESARAVFGSTVVRHGDGSEHDLGGEWRSVTLHDAVAEAVGTDVNPDTSVAELQKIAADREVEIKDSWGAGEIVLELFEKLVEHTLQEPTFVRDYPVEVRPLTRQHRDDPRLAEAWDLIVFGTELATAYSELVDPVVQRERLTAQSLLAAAGDVEAMQLDEDFLRAMEYGMPPTGGMGMGMDRLLMTLTGAGIRETILYPLVRSE